MSAFAGFAAQFAHGAGQSGGSGGGYSAPSSEQLSNANRSININGVSGGATDVARLLAIAQGPTANGGFSDMVLPPGTYTSLERSDGNMKWIILGGILLLAVLLLKSKSL